MKHAVPTAMIAICLGSLPWAALLAAQTHPHEQHAHAAAEAPAQRWIPDAPLRQGIRQAQQAVDELRHYEMGHMSAAMAVDRADTVEQAVTYMFAHCTLEAAPDAALHGILVPLLAAASTLKSHPNDVGAVANMRDALSSYPTYFDDPGWDQPVANAHEMHDET